MGVVQCLDRVGELPEQHRLRDRAAAAGGD
jgi:hypothetical protein